MLIAAVGVILVKRGVIQFVVPDKSQTTVNEALLADLENTDDVPDVEFVEGNHVSDSGENRVETNQEEADEKEAKTEEEAIEENPLDVYKTYEHDDTFLEFKSKLNNRIAPAVAKGIYITGPIAGTENTFPELENLVRNTELNTMVIDVKNDSGEITYKMDYAPAEEIGATVRYVADMKAIVDRLHEEGIYCIARVVAFKDPLLAESHPEYSLHNSDGSIYYDNNGMAWVNPYKPEVWEYIYDVSEIAADLGFDEIQFDYIRFSTGSGMSDVDFGPQAESISKTEIICKFLEEAYRRLAPKGVYVSADVFGTIINSRIDGELIGQDFIDMSKYCDYICPMIYPSHYASGSYGIDVPDANPHDTVYAAIKDAVDQLEIAKELEPDESFAKLRPWFQGFTASWVDGYVSYTGKQLRSQINGSEELGVEEWFIWNATNNYDAVKDGLN